MKHVLIAEDLEESRYLLQVLLEGNGYRVTVARDGLEALAAARREPPDVIVSDALMPRMDGFALCRAWMQDDSLRLIPFVFYSATYTDPRDERFALALGAVRYLVKPQEPEAFLGELRAVLQEWATRPAPGPIAPLDDAAFSAHYDATRSRKLESKLAQLEALNRKLRESEQTYRQLFEANPQPMWVYDLQTLRFLAVNDAAVARYGYSSDEFLAMTIADIRPAADVPRLLEEVARGGKPGFGEATLWQHRRRDGTLIDVEITSHLLDFQGRRGKMVMANDVTERLRGEHELADSEERFRGLVEQSISGIYVNQDGKFAYVNRRFAEILGYASTDELIGLDVLMVIAEKDRAAVADSMDRRLRGETLSESFTAGALQKDGSSIEIGVHGASAMYRDRPAIIGMMQDISEKKRAEDQIQGYIAQLESAFMSTVEVATTLSEMRDPYTAGHERRVADIAVAIGGELGLDARHQEGLRVAGYLHDIGKITIPAEILSKPGKLSPIEYLLIKGHAQASYDVLKGVEFPWPVAEVARQHHERLDGSGYPQGLKGESIMLEARILAVADVIEAMSSHRPYRAGLGTDKALAEIESGSGSVYDPQVVDACLRLFREKGYTISA
jgi:PAS domain S-box-containing protein